MNWITILLIVSSVLIVVQVLLAVVNTDFEFDTDHDIVSFKGVVHFLFGYSLTLWLVGSTLSPLLRHVVAAAVGAAFVLLLAMVYRLTYKLRQETTYTTVVDEMPARVYWYSPSQHEGECTVVLDGKPVNIPFENPDHHPLKVGEEIVVSGTRDLITTVKPLT